LDCPVNNSEKLVGGLVRPCGAVEGLGITAEANLIISTLSRQVLHRMSHPGQRAMGYALPP